MPRVEAVDRARALLGPHGYADYLWRGNGDQPLCQVGTLVGLTFEPLVTTDTFEAALAQARPLGQRLAEYVAGQEAKRR